MEVYLWAVEMVVHLVASLTDNVRHSLSMLGFLRRSRSRHLATSWIFCIRGNQGIAEDLPGTDM